MKHRHFAPCAGVEYCPRDRVLYIVYPDFEVAVPQLDGENPEQWAGRVGPPVLSAFLASYPYAPVKAWAAIEKAPGFDHGAVEVIDLSIAWADALMVRDSMGWTHEQN